MHTRQLGKNGPRVSAIGLGCMGMTDFYTPGSDTTEATATLHRALEPVGGGAYGHHGAAQVAGSLLLQLRALDRQASHCQTIRIGLEAPCGLFEAERFSPCQRGNAGRRSYQGTQ